jgi:hypothetical protein
VSSVQISGKPLLLPSTAIPAITVIQPLSPYTSISIPKNLRNSIPGMADRNCSFLSVSSVVGLRFSDHGGSRRVRRLLGVFNFGNYPILAIPAICFSPPPGLFLTFVANKNTFTIRRLGLPCVTLGWPLGHAWATQGPPNPKPSRICASDRSG